MARGEYGLARQAHAPAVVEGDLHFRAAVRRDWRRVREKWDGLTDNQRKAIAVAGYSVAAVGVLAIVIHVVRK